MNFTKEQAKNLLWMWGDGDELNGLEPTITVVSHDDELVAWDTELPEEGSIEL